MRLLVRPAHLVAGIAVSLLFSTTAQAQLTWSLKAAFTDPRTGSGIEGGCASLIGSNIYVSHGHRFGDSALLSIYSIPGDSWTHGGPLAPDAAFFRSEMAGGTALGRHYAIGGRAALPYVEEFDPVGAVWTTKAPLLTPRGGLGGASFAGLIYAVGGRDGATFGSGTLYSTNEVYNPVADVWSPLASMPIAVSDNYATVAFAGRVYVLGGATSPGTVTGAVQIYNIASNTWSLGASMPTPRGAAMAGVICDQIAVFGGFDGATNLDITEFYDPASDTWTSGPTMVFPASEMAQGVTYNATEIYAIGSGIFGPSEMVVQALGGTCESVRTHPTTWGNLKAKYR